MSSSPKAIQVYLRVRPPMGREVSDRHTFDCIGFPSANGESDSVTLQLPMVAVSKPTFRFTRVFRPEDRQDVVYAHFGAPAVAAALSGEHGVLLAYGQTGSGKTHTMAGDGGVVYRAVEDLWVAIAADEAHEYEVCASAIEIYADEMYDMGQHSKPKIKFHHRENALISVASKDDTMRLFAEATARREVASTGMNARSSRSHLVFSVHVLRKPSAGEAAALDGELMICDLAGSERLGKTQCSGKQRDEGIAINLSLLALGNAVSALAQGDSLVRFRDSVLTRLLQEALCGHGNTSIMITASPSDHNGKETWHAIEFGQRARGLKQSSKKHEILNYKSLYHDALGDITGLQQQLRERNELIARLEAEIRRYKGTADQPNGDSSSSSSSSSASSSQPSPRGVLDEGGEAIHSLVGHNSRTPIGMSANGLAAEIADLRSQLEEANEIIQCQDDDIGHLEALLESEHEQRRLMGSQYASTCEDVVRLKAVMEDILSKSQHASPNASPPGSFRRREGRLSVANDDGVDAQSVPVVPARSNRKGSSECCTVM